MKVLLIYTHALRLGHQLAWHRQLGWGGMSCSVGLTNEDAEGPIKVNFEEEYCQSRRHLNLSLPGNHFHFIMARQSMGLLMSSLHPREEDCERVYGP